MSMESSKPRRPKAEGTRQERQDSDPGETATPESTDLHGIPELTVTVPAVDIGRHHAGERDTAIPCEPAGQMPSEERVRRRLTRATLSPATPDFRARGGREATAAASRELSAATAALVDVLANSITVLPSTAVRAAAEVIEADVPTLQHGIRLYHALRKPLAAALAQRRLPIGRPWSPATAADLAVAATELNDYLRRLTDYDERQQRVVVAPGLDGKIDVNGTPRPVTDVALETSRAVVIGEHNKLTVIHHCHVQSPTVEVADLLHADTNWFLIWLRSTPLVEKPGTAEHLSTDVRSGVLIAIRHSDGLVIGDHNNVEANVHHQITGCRLNAVALLQNRTIRQAVLDYKEFVKQGDDVSAREAFQTLLSLVGDAAAGLAPHPVDVHSSRPELDYHADGLTVRGANGVGVGTCKVRTRTVTDTGGLNLSLG
ncbi:hypothetical protein [Krasilnikovia sp. MM14-A1259]|uniref:hypothetical protein n=1 Tax=Krasilnikovia sp. MM14-A1259 TaxID=3373539 RepID=UPI003818B31E